MARGSREIRLAPPVRGIKGGCLAENCRKMVEIWKRKS